MADNKRFEVTSIQWDEGKRSTFTTSFSNRILAEKAVIALLEKSWVVEAKIVERTVSEDQLHGFPVCR